MSKKNYVFDYYKMVERGLELFGIDFELNPERESKLKRCHNQSVKNIQGRTGYVYLGNEQFEVMLSWCRELDEEHIKEHDLFEQYGQEGI